MGIEVVVDMDVVQAEVVNENQKIDNFIYCGRQHNPKHCPVFGEECNKCHKLNNFQNMCRSKKTTIHCPSLKIDQNYETSPETMTRRVKTGNFMKSKKDNLMTGMV